MASTYGVTYNDISDNVHNLSINPASSPSSTAVTDMIAFYAAEIAREQEVVGIDNSSITSGTDAYSYAKKALIAAVSGEVLVSRNRGDENAGKFYTDLYKTYITNLRRRPQVQQDTSEGPNLVREITNELNPNTRTFNCTLAGKLVTGGL